MSAPAPARNILMALLLSLVAGFFLAVTYTFYPLITATASNLADSRGAAGSGGIGAVAGGVGGSFLWAMLVATPVFFLIIFALLQRRRMPR